MSKSLDDFQIETSHLYVKIYPKDFAEEELIKKDTTQNFFDYPLDYEFTDEIGHQVGTGNPELVSAYYVAVPANYKFPEGIKKEILEELYIPEQDPYFEDIEETGLVSQKGINSKEDLLGNLIMTAFKLTNNENQLNVESKISGKSAWWIFGSKWRPTGRITMFDNSLNKEVPVEGAQILIRQWFTVDSGITDANGYFSTGTVRGRAQYVIQWERNHYDIRNGWFGQAETKGPSRKNEPWYYVVNGEQNVQFAMIHRATHHYYYKDIKGLRRPPLNGEMPVSRLKIAAINSYNSDSNGDYSYWRGAAGILPMIRIYKRNLSREYYGTVIHELAHASHWKMAWWTFQSVDEKVKESWARGVQWELTRMVYPTYINNYSKIYTGVVQDMIDNDNSIADKVSGYTIRQIENSLMYQKTWNDWKNKIKQDYENPTENNLDALFDYWNNF